MRRACQYAVAIGVWVNAHGFEDEKLILLERIMNDLKNAGIIPGGKSM